MRSPFCVYAVDGTIFDMSARRTCMLIMSLRRQGWLYFCLMVAINACRAACAQGQEVPFTPRYDGISDSPQKKVVQDMGVSTPKPQPVYSFARFASLVKLICAHFEEDGRQERVYLVTKKSLADDIDCPSCRALYRQFVLSCDPKLRVKKSARLPDNSKPLLSSSPSPAASAAAESQPSDGFEPLLKFDGVDDVTPTPAPTRTPEPQQPVRYPTTQLIDSLSRLSAEMYEFEPGYGSTFMAIKSFESRLMSVSDLSPGERDYFSIVSAYLLSAWEGRPNSPLNVTQVNPTEIAELFE